MSLIVYGSSHSRAIRVLWMLEELALPYEHQPMDFRECSQNPEFLAINPAGQIPCIVDQGFALAESLAINLYLAEKTGLLLPADLSGKALAQQWTLWAATALEPDFMRWALHALWMPEALRQPTLAQEALAALQKPLARLEVALAKSEWLVADAFSVADLNVAAVINFMQGHVRNHPKVASWLDRCLARPAYKAAQNKP